MAGKQTFHFHQQVFASRSFTRLEAQIYRVNFAFRKQNNKLWLQYLLCLRYWLLIFGFPSVLNLPSTLTAHVSWCWTPDIHLVPCLKGEMCSPHHIQIGKADVLIETTESTSRLTIPESQEEDCGCYTVEVRNSCGMRQAALNLTIVGR